MRRSDDPANGEFTKPEVDLTSDVKEGEMKPAKDYMPPINNTKPYSHLTMTDWNHEDLPKALEHYNNVIPDDIKSGLAENGRNFTNLYSDPNSSMSDIDKNDYEKLKLVEKIAELTGFPMGHPVVKKLADKYYLGD